MMSDDRAEGGFTLIEFMVAMTLTVLVFAALAIALIATSGNYTASATKLAESHDAQLLSSWLQPDVASAGPAPADVDTAWGASATGCSGGVLPGSGNILKLTWSDFDSGTTFAAAYRLEGTQLVRYFCTAGGDPSLTIVGRNVTLAAATVNALEITVAVTVTVLAPQSYSFNVSASRRTIQIPVAITTLPPATTTLPPTTTTTVPATTTTT